MLVLILSCLLHLLAYSTIAVQAQGTKLELNHVTSFLASSGAFQLPESTAPLSVSVALCADSYASLPRMYVSNGTDAEEIEVKVVNGIGSFIGVATMLRLESSQDVEIGVSDNGMPLGILSEYPMFGDSSASQAILFSRPFDSADVVQPSWPNYTLPAAGGDISSAPANNLAFTLMLSATPLTDIPQTSCALKKHSMLFNSTLTKNGDVSLAREESWLQDRRHWRTKWMLEGLQPGTNYTVYVEEAQGRLSGPMFFKTKSATFNCAMVTSLPYCPHVNYAVPIPAPADGGNVYTADNLDKSISEPLVSALTNFTISLKTFACGRDLYSPLQSCADCQYEYRQWLCAISFPRCVESPPSSSSSSLPSPALVNHTLARRGNLPAFDAEYNVLLPCLETCNAVDRACPSFLGFTCPTSHFYAQKSYGVGFIDGGDEGANVAGGGSTGEAQDRYGNVWCQMG